MMRERVKEGYKMQDEIVLKDDADSSMRRQQTKKCWPNRALGGQEQESESCGFCRDGK